MAANPNKPTRTNPSSYDQKYPYNRVTVTEGGHEIHFDDTPGKERIRIAHKKGSYVEISPDGKRIDFNVGHSKAYHKGGHTLTIDENGDIKIHGHKRINVGGGSHISVKGDADVVVGKNSHTVVGGNMKAAVAGDAYLGVKGNGNMNVKGNWDVKVGGSTKMTTGGTHTIIASTIHLNP